MSNEVIQDLIIEGAKVWKPDGVEHMTFWGDALAIAIQMHSRVAKKVRLEICEAVYCVKRRMESQSDREGMDIIFMHILEPTLALLTKDLKMS